MAARKRAPRTKTARKPRKRPGKQTKRRTAKQAAVELVIEDRRAAAARLRVAGWPMRDIAAHLGVSLGTVHSDLEAVLERTVDTADDIVRRERAISNERLDAMTKGLWDKASGGVISAAEAVVKIEKRRSELNGFDAPKRHELSGPGGGAIPLEAKSSLERRLDQLAERLQSEPGGTAGGSTPAPS